MSAEKRLQELGIKLPSVPTPVANYVPYRIAGGMLYLSGQGPRDANGNHLTGQVGGPVSVEEGYKRARLVGLGLLGMVNGVPGFGDQPKVINGCSDLFVEVLGDAGRHARSAVGMGSLPSDISVEIEVIMAVKT
jgi:enamine deaminase RidA (YjgF/YER057c/UK114 family)